MIKITKIFRIPNGITEKTDKFNNATVSLRNW